MLWLNEKISLQTITKIHMFSISYIKIITKED